MLMVATMVIVATELQNVISPRLTMWCREIDQETYIDVALMQLLENLLTIEVQMICFVCQKWCKSVELTCRYAVVTYLVIYTHQFSGHFTGESGMETFYVVEENAAYFS